MLYNRDPDDYFSYHFKSRLQAVSFWIVERARNSRVKKWRDWSEEKKGEGAPISPLLRSAISRPVDYAERDRLQSILNHDD